LAGSPRGFACTPMPGRHPDRVRGGGDARGRAGDRAESGQAMGQRGPARHHPHAQGRWRMVAGGDSSLGRHDIRSCRSPRDPASASVRGRGDGRRGNDAAIGLAARVLVTAIDFYQRYLSPILPSACRFEPTCSAYAGEAIRRYGAARGVALSAWRLLRCQPLCPGGEDPVP
jgi:putative membrane protein insertion efficiency factor